MAKNNKKSSENAEALDETKSTKKANKAKKAEPQKPNVFQRIGKWFRDLKIEFKNVTWPTKQTVMTNTGVVLSVIVIGSVVIGRSSASRPRYDTIASALDWILR